MRRLLVATTGLFFISVTVHAMEITEKDFVFKRKEQSFLRSLFCKKDNEKDNKTYPNFANNNDSHRTFANHELLWANKMKDEEIIPWYLIDYILKIRYAQIISNKYKGEKPCRGKELSITPVWGLFDNMHNTVQDIFWANKKQQRIIYYFMMHAKQIDHHFRIEGSNVQFSREIAQEIDNLPKSIKEHLMSRSNDTFYVQVNEPPLLGVCLDKLDACLADDRVKYYADGVKYYAKIIIPLVTAGGTSAFSAYCAWKTCRKIGNSNFYSGACIGGGVAGILGLLRNTNIDMRVGHMPMQVVESLVGPVVGFSVGVGVADNIIDAIIPLPELPKNPLAGIICLAALPLVIMARAMVGLSVTGGGLLGGVVGAQGAVVGGGVAKTINAIVGSEMGALMVAGILLRLQGKPMGGVWRGIGRTVVLKVGTATGMVMGGGCVILGENTNEYIANNLVWNKRDSLMARQGFEKRSFVTIKKDNI